MLRQSLATCDSLEALSRRLGLPLERSPKTCSSPVWWFKTLAICEGTSEHNVGRSGSGLGLWLHEDLVHELSCSASSLGQPSTAMGAVIVPSLPQHTTSPTTSLYLSAEPGDSSWGWMGPRERKTTALCISKQTPPFRSDPHHAACLNVKKRKQNKTKQEQLARCRCQKAVS